VAVDDINRFPIPGLHVDPHIETTCLQRITNSYKLPAAIKAKAAQRLEGAAV
jgi:hypothetical protein